MSSGRLCPETLAACDLESTILVTVAGAAIVLICMQHMHEVMVPHLGEKQLSPLACGVSS